jgi:hypothetical protein
MESNREMVESLGAPLYAAADISIRLSAGVVVRSPGVGLEGEVLAIFVLPLVVHCRQSCHLHCLA